MVPESIDTIQCHTPTNATHRGDKIIDPTTIPFARIVNPMLRKGRDGVL